MAYCRYFIAEHILCKIIVSQTISVHRPPVLWHVAASREVLRQTDHDPNAAGLLLLSEAETHQPPIGPSPSGSPDGCLHTVPLGRCCGSIGSTLGQMCFGFKTPWGV